MTPSMATKTDDPPWILVDSDGEEVSHDIYVELNLA